MARRRASAELLGSLFSCPTHLPLSPPRALCSYLYTSGFKAATKITEQGKAYLVSKLPPFATAAFDHKLSRYLKEP